LKVVPHEIGDHVDEHTSINEDFSMNVDEEDDPDDGLQGMVRELYSAEEEGKEKTSMFAILLEEMKQELYPGGICTRFSFVVKLLHIKSFYRISNVAFTALLKLLSSAFPNCSIPATYGKQRDLSVHWGSDTIQSMCARIIVFCFGRTWRKMMFVQFVVHQDGKTMVGERRFLRRFCDIFH